MSQNVDTKQNKIFDEKHKNLQKEIKNRKILKNNENVKPKSKDISISQQNPPQNRKSTPNIAKSQAKVRKRLPSKALSANKSTLSKSPKDLEFSLSEVQKWNPEKVSDWICSISPRFDEYRESLVKLRIHGDILLGCLTKNALAEVVDNPLLLSILWENIVNLRQILN
ncbi:hypothetical protein MHBO_004973 [Bonamia ostreae]|uniref:SAM domain-containing protein n=1 Tax=Bonamia ostreae TaxID=126728 RepID=A0ABV2AVI3_9EUKA